MSSEICIELCGNDSWKKFESFVKVCEGLSWTLQGHFDDTYMSYNLHYDARSGIHDFIYNKFHLIKEQIGQNPFSVKIVFTDRNEGVFMTYKGEETKVFSTYQKWGFIKYPMSIAQWRSPSKRKIIEEKDRIQMKIASKKNARDRFYSKMSLLRSITKTFNLTLPR
jgi:hypothetical protein